MRINLTTPFAEKDAAKALGARWDGSKKLWYIVDVTDLTPFLRWIPNMDAAKVGSDGALQTTKPSNTSANSTKTHSPSKSVNDVPHCGCDVQPWEDCVHTAIPRTPGAWNPFQSSSTKLPNHGQPFAMPRIKA